jgi:predicted nucleic acid-binding protein
LTPRLIAISLITYGEIYDGINWGHAPERHERAFKQFLGQVDVLPLNRRIMRQFAQLRGMLRRQGQILPEPDLLIAATALHYNLILVTGNARHFQRIPGLTIQSP